MGEGARQRRAHRQVALGLTFSVGACSVGWPGGDERCGFGSRRRRAWWHRQLSSGQRRRMRRRRRWRGAGARALQGEECRPSTMLVGRRSQVTSTRRRARGREKSLYTCQKEMVGEIQCDFYAPARPRAAPQPLDARERGGPQPLRARRAPRARFFGARVRTLLCVREAFRFVARSNRNETRGTATLLMSVNTLCSP